ncbi:glycine cleavage system regulatory protein [Nocardioides sp. BE266]|uniref:glycine cleavage system protein R n=1 Tax=Nocardioides sp. BE266 TaxID=2817725 RepID=UPI002855E0BB|nr:ACT domain-containing protein [Nocardioides sp. BE266]MDR7255130.1 glycine cleavage system regulatory protein [Nocardioides sp. BE266]
MATFVLTLFGDDRPGLVSDIAGAISARGGSWEHSQLTQAAGKFAGIVVVSAPEDAAEAMLASVHGLEDEGFHVLVDRTDPPVETARARFSLELVGADRPGIIAQIAALLVEHRVSIEDLVTELTDAPMAGGKLFEARAVLVAPESMSASDLSAALEDLADRLMVDVHLSLD